jgi:hypothetical protein
MVNVAQDDALSMERGTVKEYINGIFEREINHDNLDYRTGVVMSRYFTENFRSPRGIDEEHVSQAKVTASNYLLVLYCWWAPVSALSN